MDGVMILMRSIFDGVELILRQLGHPASHPVLLGKLGKIQNVAPGFLLH
jgi:hypothetical protein